MNSNIIKEANNISYTRVLIIGGGAGGMGAAFNLKGKDITLIEAENSNSAFSPWNIMIKPKDELEKEMFKASNGMSDIKLLKTFIKHREDVVKDLQRLGIKFRKSNIGVVPDYERPGLEIKNIFNSYINKKDVRRVYGHICNFLVDSKNNIKGVIVNNSRNEKEIIVFNYLILAGGGISSLFNLSTGEKKVNGSILALCNDAGLTIVNMEFMMFHPFLLVDERLPKMLISGDILTKMKFIDENDNSFLSEEIENALENNQHHNIFPKMVREFYLQSLKGKIFANLICDEAWFNKYKDTNEFGYIFKDRKLSEIQRISISPTFHYSIGGLKINERAMTSQKNIYAVGEISGGLHGSNRIGGTAVAEAWAFGKIAALDINSKKDNKIAKVNVDTLHRIGKLGLSDNMKKRLWKAIGPVKNIRALRDLEAFLQKKKDLLSEEKLILNIVKVCLMRKESVGAFYRDDLPSVVKAKCSYISGNKIYFK